MRSRRALASISTAAAAAALACAVAGPAAARPGARWSCPPAGVHVIGRGGMVRVYTTGGAPIGAHPVEACLAGRPGHMTLLRHIRGAGLGQSLEVAASSGPLVAYLITTRGVDSGSTSLVIADVAARRVLRELPVGNYVDAGILEREAPTKIVLGPEGAVGWIAVSHGPSHVQTYTVLAAATIGPVEILDEGPDIGSSSLTLSSRRLGWWRAGSEHHAPLP